MKSRFAWMVTIIGVTLWGNAAEASHNQGINEVNPTVNLNLPSGVTPGIVNICEGPLATDGTCGPLGSANFSDQLIFGDATGSGLANVACLFSDSEPDASCPAFFGSTNLSSYIVETRAADGSETMLYTPTANQPGGGMGITYFITSDSAGESDTPTPTPEPASLALLGSGILALAGFIKHRLR